MGKLAGKVAIVTGGGAGIGGGSARVFAREGAKVALLEINPETGRATEREIHAAGGEALFIQTDVTDEVSVHRAVTEAVAGFGGLDILFNVVGGSDAADKPVDEMDVDYWLRGMKLNLLSAFLVSKYAIPQLRKAGGGAIINLTSYKGAVGADRPVYSASKGAIIALTRTMASQYAQDNIRVNAILAGLIATERAARKHAAGSPEYLATLDRRRKNYPFGHGKPEDVGAVAAFLASDEARMVNGTTVRADGGTSTYFKFV